MKNNIKALANNSMFIAFESHNLRPLSVFKMERNGEEKVGIVTFVLNKNVFYANCDNGEFAYNYDEVNLILE